jgi:uroporphyrinogen decarboxylase
MSGPRSSADRVRAALDFEPLDYVPLFDQYWGGFVADWRRCHGRPPRSDLPLDDIAYGDEAIQSYFGVDMHKAIPNEDPWPSQKGRLRLDGEYIVERDGWGRVVRRRATSPYGVPLELKLVHKGDLDRLAFEPAGLDRRYAAMLAELAGVRRLPRRPYIFVKVGGPFLRSSFLRGEMQWYMDLAEDPEFASMVMTRVADHLIAVGTEALKRAGLAGASIWIFDDVASNHGPLIHPRTYERLILPQVRRMVAAFKAAGATHVGYHSDGDVRPLLDGLVDGGIGILNPVEPRANMDVVQLRRRYGRRLSFVGGVCNSSILPHGSDAEVRRHVDHVLSIAADGGLVVGSHSISNDISQERYHLFMEILHHHGRPRPGCYGDN